MTDIFTLPSQPDPTREHYSAASAEPLDTLNCSAIRARVEAIGQGSPQTEGYLTGWMDFTPLVIIRDYQDRRGTSSGFMLSVGNDYRFSVQTITPRIPKLLLWATLRNKPKTLPLIAVQNLAAGDKRLIPYRALRDATLQQKMTGWWQSINDYLGAACWQLSHDCPGWRSLNATLNVDDIHRLHRYLQDSPQALEQDGDYAGRWVDGLFIATREACDSNPWPSLLLSWKSPQRQASYLIGWLDDGQGQATLALALRPDLSLPFFTLNRFDAEHLQRIATLSGLAIRHSGAE